MNNKNQSNPIIKKHLLTTLTLITTIKKEEVICHEFSRHGWIVAVMRL
jgi:hypothetical protein